mgnify:CR=1 FL=1
MALTPKNIQNVTLLTVQVLRQYNRNARPELCPGVSEYQLCLASVLWQPSIVIAALFEDKTCYDHMMKHLSTFENCRKIKPYDVSVFWQISESKAFEINSW